MKSRRAAFAALVAFVFGIGMSFLPAHAQDPIRLPEPRPAHAPKATTVTKTSAVVPKPPSGGYTKGRVIVLRGLHNVWSRGMDALAKNLEAEGVNVTLENHARWRRLADEAIADYKKDKNTAPIIIIGHSLGGDAALVMSNWIVHNGVPVRLIVAFDPVAQTHPVRGGVQEVINYYRPRGYGQKVTGTARFNGKIANVDLTDREDMNHLNIDKHEGLQAEVLAKTLTVLQE